MDESEFFVNEAETHIIKGEKDILKFEKDPYNVQIISELKHVFQALDRLASSIGLSNVSMYCNIFGEFLEESGNMQKVSEKPNSFINLNLESFAALRSIIDKYTGGKLIDLTENRINTLKAQIEDFKKKFEITFINPIPVHQINLILNDKRNNFYRIHILIEPTCKFKKVRLFFIFRSLNKIGRLCWSIPDPAILEKGDFDNEFEIFYLSEEKPDVIRSSLEEILEIEKKSIHKLKPKKFESLIKKVNISTQKEYIEKMSEDLIKETKISDDFEIPFEIRRDYFKNIKLIYTDHLNLKNDRIISIPNIHFLTLIHQDKNDVVFYTKKNEAQNDYTLYLIKQGYLLVYNDNDFEFFEKIFEIQKKGYANFLEFLDATKYGIKSAEIYKKFKKSKFYSSNINSYFEFLEKN